MLSFLSPLTHFPLPLSLTLLSCLTAHAISRPFLMLSASRSHSLCRRKRRQKSKILAAKPLWSHNITPYICYAMSLVTANANDHNHGDLRAYCNGFWSSSIFSYLISGFGDLDFVVKIWYSLHVLVLDFDFKCIWFLWIVWFQMYLVSVNRKFE